MIKSDKGELVLAGQTFLLGADLMLIIDGVVDTYENSDVDICKAAFKCASYKGDIPKLIKFAELMKEASEQ